MAEDSTRPKQQKHKEFARLLDSRFRIPNTDIRFGIDPVIGLLPGVGDWIGGVASLYFMLLAALHGGKASVLGRMFINIMLDVIVGAIPVLGEVFDVYWKANDRNARLLRELQENPEEATSESRLWVWLVFIQFVVLLIGILLLISWIVAELLALLF